MELPKEQEKIAGKLGNKGRNWRSLLAARRSSTGTGANPHRAMKLFNEQEQICRETRATMTNCRGLWRARAHLPGPGRTRPCHGTFQGTGTDLPGDQEQGRAAEVLGNQALIHRDLGEPDRAMELHKEEERIPGR